MGMLRIADVLTAAALLVAVGGRRMIRNSEEQALQSKETSEGTALPEAPDRVLSLPKATLQADEDGTFEWAEYDGCKYMASNTGSEVSVEIPSNDSDLAYGMKMAVSAGADLVAVDGHSYTFINLHRDGTEVALDPQAISCHSVNQGSHQLLVRRSAKLTAPSCPVSDSDKSDCGFHGISESQCEDKGCCWAESHTGRGVPWCFHKSDTEPAFVWLNTEGRTHLLAKARGMLADCRDNMAMGMQEVIRDVGFQGRELDIERDSYNNMVASIMLLPMGPIGGMVVGKATTTLVNNPALKEHFTSSTSKISKKVFEHFQHLASSKDAQTILVGKAKGFASKQYGKAMASSKEAMFVRAVEGWAAQINEENQKVHQQMNDDFRGWSNQEVLFTIAAGKWDQSSGDESTCSVGYQKARFAEMMKTVVGIIDFGQDCPWGVFSCGSGRWHKAWCHGGSTGGRFASIYTETRCSSGRAAAGACRELCEITLKDEIPYARDFLPDLNKGMGHYRGCPGHCFIKGR